MKSLFEQLVKNQWPLTSKYVGGNTIIISINGIAKTAGFEISVGMALQSTVSEIAGDYLKIEVENNQIRLTYKNQYSTLVIPHNPIEKLEGLRHLYSLKMLLLEIYETLTQYSSSHNLAVAIASYVNSNLSVNRYEVAKYFNISESYTSRLIKRYYEQTFKAFSFELQMNKALELLRKTSDKVKEIANECGFKNPEHFIRLFRERFGFTPLKFRQALNGDLGALLKMKDLKEYSPLKLHSEINQLWQKFNDYEEQEVHLLIINLSEEILKIKWVNPHRKRVDYGSLETGQRRLFYTYKNHIWSINDSLVQCTEKKSLVII